MSEKRENSYQPKEESTRNWEDTSREITAEALKIFIVENMPKLDTNKSGSVSEREIRNALTESKNSPDKFTDEGLRMLRKIKEHYGTLSRITLNMGESKHWGAEINPRDMIVFALWDKQLRQEQKEVAAALKFAKDNFDALDKDGNGYLSMPELYSSIKTHNSEVATLMLHGRKISSANSDEWFWQRTKGLSRKDLDTYPTKWLKEGGFLNAEGNAVQSVGSMRLPYRINKGDILKVTEKK